MLVDPHPAGVVSALSGREPERGNDPRGLGSTGMGDLAATYL